MPNTIQPNDKIPFNRPYITGNEMTYLMQAQTDAVFSGNGPFTKRCQAWLQKQTLCHKALLVHSCTAALEMAALLADIQPGDEIIMPSYTFVSTANAFVLRGGVPVFVDIRADTLNLDETLIETAITSKTKAIVPVHYAGIACEMGQMITIAKQNQLITIEDAAQGVMANYHGKALGTIGDLGAFSFHATKNVISGEGGALLINDPTYTSRAEILWEKGTNRSQFLKGETDKYTWQDLGSSYLPGEIIAAFLAAQLESAQDITQQRLNIWNYYHQLLEALEKMEVIRRPIIPTGCEHNAHLYYVLLPPSINRHALLTDLMKHGIQAVSHYVPLHSSPAGQRFGRASGSMPITNHVSEHIIRLPLWVGLTQSQQERIVETLAQSIAVCSETT